MRVALVFLAGMAFVAGFNKHARSLDERSMQAMPPTTAAEFAAYKQRWRANLLAANVSLSSGDHAAATANR
jgi:hypothetical protein